MKRKRGNQVKVLFDDREYQAFLNLCEQSGLKKGTYCRVSALNPGTSQDVVLIPAEMLELRAELGRIGNNLNQISRHLNAGNVMDGVDALRVTQAAQNASDRLQALIEILRDC